MKLLVWLTAALAAVTAADPGTADFDPGKLPFSVEVRGERIDYRVFGISVPPGEVLELRVARPVTGAFGVAAPAGDLLRSGPRHWRWKAPDAPGLSTLEIRPESGGDAMTLNVFTVVPREQVKEGVLNGYRIGEYPAVPLRGLEVYRRPAGFIEVTEENADTRLSPHFKLRQFLCKQEGGWPKYAIVRPRLLLKLEFLLEKANAAGYRADTFFVMSGFRTPWYNRAIGNVKYSRHVYGGAVDVFIDENPRDGVMDDLNGDGKIDVLDAGVLYGLVESLRETAEYKPFIGGMGRYRTTSSHGPFVHVDVRGFFARWGD